MGQEIERKFLVKDAAWRSAVVSSQRIRQGYLAVNERCGVRVRIDGHSAQLNIKSATLDIVRDEYEYQIPPEDAREMLSRLCGNLIEKERHLVFVGGHKWEVDEFTGDNNGLIIAEVELRNRSERFERPDWLGVEVSGDPRYLNSYLAENPYTSWRPDERHANT